MPVFDVETQEIWVQTYRVEADTMAEAIAKVYDGDAEPVADTFAHTGLDINSGMPIDEDSDLATELINLGYPPDGEIINGIKDIQKVSD